MKNLTLLVALLIAFGGSLAQSQTRRSPYVKLNLIEKFGDRDLNLYDDAHFGARGADVYLVGTYNQDFVVTFTKDEDVGFCGVVKTWQIRTERGLGTVVQIKAEPEVDGGSTCTATIRYKTGAKAKIAIFATGG